MALSRWKQVGVVVGSFCLHVVVMGLSLSFGILYSKLHTEFRVTQSHAAWVASLFTGLIGIAGVPVSWLVGRVGERITALVGSAIVSCSMVSCSFVGTFDCFYVTYGIVGGLGACMCILPSTTVVMKSFDTNRPLAIAISSSGSAVGNLCLPPLLTYMISEYGWRGTFLLLGGLALQCLPAALLLVSDRQHFEKDVKISEQSTEKGKDSFRSITFSVLKNTKFMLFAVSVIPSFMVIFVPVVFLPDFMKELGLSDQQIYIAIMAYGSGNLIGGLSPGVLERVFRLDLMSVYTAVLLLGVASSVPFVATRLFEQCILLALVAGLASGALLSVHDSLVANILDKRQTEIGFGWLSAVEGVMVVIGMPIAGFITDETRTLRSGFLFAGSAMAVSLGMSVIAKLAFVGWKEQTDEVELNIKQVSEQMQHTCQTGKHADSLTTNSGQNNTAFISELSYI